ncbi:hypothetical protein GDO78_012946 [Eleutherodactylus coqui]|uniref:Uncharacterized protein n=1 Tax=Eleutherodactylus coqui TaxID=57060 RepID=A0A8J6EZU7_ELECQ|nr:hypothetical protein GDO78_012946 [Eleutherodactylus coqui]
MSDDESSVDHSGQDYISPLADSRPGQKLSAQLPDSGSSEGVPIPAHANRTVEVSDAIRMERLIQSCSAAVLLGQQHAARKGQQYEPIPVSLPAPDLRPRLVWILGNYFITSVYRRMSKIPDGRQLGFPRSKATIRWLEHEKLPWDDVIPAVSHYAKKYGHPDILIVHAGESELASTRTKELTQYIQGDLLKLRSILPLAVIVWSQMVCIRKRPAPYSGRRLDRACNKINNAVSIHLEGSGVVCINHSNLLKETSDLFKRSGLTLTLVGTKIFCTNLQEGIEKALQLWKQSHGVNA